MKKTVFLTGATGVMGMEAVKRFVEHPDEIELYVLARPGAKNEEKLAPYADKIHIVWGDLTDFDLLTESMKGMDYVFHVGALLPPMADDFPPEVVMKTNYGSTKAMLRGIKKFHQEETTHFIYIGTIEMVGHRSPPMHWGRVGDPLQPPVYCYYALSKVFSERAVAESGLKYWASVRQSFQNPNNPKAAEYPIIGMQPDDNCSEHIDCESSGNLCVQIALHAPDEFWRHGYNLGGGPGFRFSNFEFIKALHGDFRRDFNPNWIATRNYHGHYFLDSDKLNEMIPYRLKAPDKFLMDELMHQIKLAKAGPRRTLAEIKERNKEILNKKGGTLYYEAQGNEEAIKVYFGSLALHDALPDTWDTIPETHPSTDPADAIIMDHGYDESKPVSELGIEDMQQAAAFRGGKCLCDSMKKGDMFTPLRWQCALGHEFTAAPNTVLGLGHWCPHCLAHEWDYFTQAKVNPYFAQDWDYLHKDEEPYKVKMETSYEDVDKLFEE